VTALRGWSVTDYSPSAGTYFKSENLIEVRCSRMPGGASRCRPAGLAGDGRGYGGIRRRLVGILLGRALFDEQSDGSTIDARTATTTAAASPPQTRARSAGRSRSDDVAEP